MSDGRSKPKFPHHDEPVGTEPFVINTVDARVQLSAVPTFYPPRTQEPLKDRGALEPYSREFHDKLIAAHSDWREFCRMIATESGNALYVEVPAPSSAIGKLWISTEDFRITVGVGADFHGHFDMYAPETNDAVFDRAFQFVEELVEERLVLVVAMLDRTCGCSWVQRSGEPINLPESIRQRSSFQYDRLCSFSWRSTHDREIVPN